MIFRLPSAPAISVRHSTRQRLPAPLVHLDMMLLGPHRPITREPMLAVILPLPTRTTRASQRQVAACMSETVMGPPSEVQWTVECEGKGCEGSEG